ncbi:hypothetical protein [Pedobacter cryoconitis]|uniref:hypothetical protein n=1 Tax=Pedobacter cryoconitis TaxID=188932 RepID=UPI000AC7C4D3|nr:hypothetical protein [Pedobacter cryoconitis]
MTEWKKLGGKIGLLSLFERLVCETRWKDSVEKLGGKLVGKISWRNWVERLVG